MRIRSALAGVVAAGSLALVLAPAPAEAASRVTVVNDRGGAQADATYRTKLTITGRGFQVVPGGFGGVYLMFGTVDDPRGGSWRPSKGGLTGEDYRYIPDSENAADNQGYLKFIAFPGSSTASEANAVLSDSGGFSVELTVPGPVFTAVDREGATQEVDCREVTCGIITIGAHGVKNPANETFTPVRFGDVYGGSAPTGTASADPSPTVGATTDGAAPAGPASESTGDQPAAGAPTTTPVRRGRPSVTTDRETAVAGHALAFTGTGFTPGEQVLAILDDGVVALGPMVAGTSGEVAGLIQLPLELAAGTHELRLTGAASGGAAAELFPVRAADPAPAAATTDDEDGGTVDAARVFLAAAVVVFLVALAGALLRLRRRRGGPRKTRAPAPAAGATP
jgi:hypothetical protein